MSKNYNKGKIFLNRIIIKTLLNKEYNFLFFRKTQISGLNICMRKIK